MQSIILRFRDLLADTIQEHRGVIEKIGYVWWGWWMKEEENGHQKELELLKSLLQKSSVTIGLFDRSSHRFFLSLLTDIQFGEKSFPTPEPSATPSYYKQANLVAWFKLKTIDGPLSESDFSSAIAPLPLGDATLFPIGFAESVKVGSAPAIGEVIPAQSNVILHISDLHFGEFNFPSKPSPGRYPLIDILKSDLKKLNTRVGIVVVSGDFTTKGDANRFFNEVVPFLRDLANALELEKEHFVLVPGNHDIPLQDFDALSYKHENAFRAFLREFYGMPSELARLTGYRLPSGRRLEFLAMNSVKLRKKDEMNYGYASWPSYDSLLSKQSAPDPDSLRIAVLHHHLVGATREDQIDPQYPAGGISVTLDSGAIIEGLQTHGFRMALHGHQHVPGVSRVSRGRYRDGSVALDGLDTSVYIVASGSTGCSRLFPEMATNTFSLLSVEPSSVSLRVRSFNSAQPPRDFVNQVLHF